MIVQRLNDEACVWQYYHFSHWSFLVVIKQIQSESKVIPLLFSAMVSRAIATCLFSESLRANQSSKPALFMTVRCEIAEPRCETGARSREDAMRTRAVR